MVRQQVNNKFNNQNINPIRALKKHSAYFDFNQTGHFKSLPALYANYTIENILKLINKNKEYYNKISQNKWTLQKGLKYI